MMIYDQQLPPELMGATWLWAEVLQNLSHPYVLGTDKSCIHEARCWVLLRCLSSHSTKNWSSGGCLKRRFACLSRHMRQIRILEGVRSIPVQIHSCDLS